MVMKRYLKCLGIVLFVFTVSFAWADTANGGGLGPNPQQLDPYLANPMQTDLSQTYLGQLFGNVGDVLHGSSGQMLGHLFLELNEGIMAVAAIWMLYTTFTLVFRGIAEGLNHKMGNIFLVFLRSAGGWAVLVPLPTNDGD